MQAPAAISLPLLDRIQIASPCHERWEDMTGDERTRHCASCRLDVHNIAGMSERDAEALLRSAFSDDGSPVERLCARVFRRADGTILTADCPVGVETLRIRARRSAARVAAALGITTLIGWAAAMEQGPGAAWAGYHPFTTVAKAIGRQHQPPVQTFTPGRIYLPPMPTPPGNNGATP